MPTSRLTAPRLWTLLTAATATTVLIMPSLPSTVLAQEYEPIRVDLGLMGAYASGIREGGFGGVVEPKYLLSDNVAVGLRLEGMVTFGASVGGGSSSFGTGSIGMLGGKVEYFLGRFEIRPSAGLGAGVYAIGGDTISTGQDQVVVAHKSGSYVGVSPSLALDIGRLRLAATYHLIAGADVEVEDMAGGASTRRDFSQDYVTFELGFYVGGSRLAPAAAPPNY